MRYLEVMQAAINTFGEREQMIVAIEELAELQKELTKILRGGGNKDTLAEEMADAQIMLDQLEIIHGDRGAVHEWQRKKMHRLAMRIAEYKAHGEKS